MPDTVSPFSRGPRRARAARPRALATLAAAAITIAIAIAASVLAGPVAAGSTPGALEGGIAASRNREGQLNAGIGADTHQIEGFQGSINDLQTRLGALESSLAIERTVLAGLKSELRIARVHLASLQVQLGRDRKVLVAQVIASYESPPPDIATVILEAHGFADLIERVNDLRAISRENAAATTRVAEEQRAVTAEADRLAALEASHARETRAVLVQRDEVAQLHLALVNRQLQFIRARDRKSAEIGELRSRRQALEQELSKIQTSELAAAGNATYSGPVGAFSGTPEGEYGFFPAPGTNYSVGEEPTIAAHLNTMGKALHLHLIGISGYRTPQHSVEVGGFANDPHTRGEASDTPGVEGVPEATLNQFGLTRPFPGAAEADHIQLG
jgi:peptidoglycan hydrolase CwlO-like protein